jgi:hypothetical protein
MPEPGEGSLASFGLFTFGIVVVVVVGFGFVVVVVDGRVTTTSITGACVSADELSALQTSA